MKKTLSIILTILMVVTMIPFTPVAFAADDYAVVDTEAGTVTIDGTLGGKTTATEEDLKDVLHLAAADFVFDLPDGMDSLCGEKGAGLSEGQAQRICIARSLLRKGGVLLLDEPTAALDPQTEEILLKRLMESAGGGTLIIVTHREAAVSVCGNVVRL